MFPCKFCWFLRVSFFIEDLTWLLLWTWLFIPKFIYLEKFKSVQAVMIIACLTCGLSCAIFFAVAVARPKKIVFRILAFTFFLTGRTGFLFDWLLIFETIVFGSSYFQEDVSFNSLCIMLKNSQTYLKNFAVVLKYIWPFFNIMHELVKRYHFGKQLETLDKITENF